MWLNLCAKLIDILDLGSKSQFFLNNYTYLDLYTYNEFMKKIFPILAIVFLISCGKPVPELSAIDLNAWKADRGGCKSQRAEYLGYLQTQIEALKGLSEDDIIKLLGRPDRNELYKRNQKFYYYDIEPGKNCGAGQPANHQLIFRFNAMSRAKEVSIEKL